MLYGSFLDIIWKGDESLYKHRTDQPKRQQPDWWNDVCMDMLLARNSAWRERRRNPTPDTAAAFRRARNKFHRVVQLAKHNYWSSWLGYIDKCHSVCLRSAATAVRRRFRRNKARIAPRLCPNPSASKMNKMLVLLRGVVILSTPFLKGLTHSIRGTSHVSSAASGAFVSNIPCISTAGNLSLCLNLSEHCTTVPQAKHRVSITFLMKHSALICSGGGMPSFNFLTCAEVSAASHPCGSTELLFRCLKLLPPLIVMVIVPSL